MMKRALSIVSGFSSDSVVTFNLKVPKPPSTHALPFQWNNLARVENKVSSPSSPVSTVENRLLSKL